MGNKATKTGARRCVFDLPSAQRRGTGREIELKEVSRAFYDQVLMGAIVTSEGNFVKALTVTIIECSKAALVRVGTERVSAELPGEVLYYQLSEREKEGLHKCYAFMHDPTDAQIARLEASAVFADGVWRFDLSEPPPPLKAGEEPPLKEGLGILKMRELQVHDIEQVGLDILRQSKDMAGIGRKERSALIDHSFVSFEGAPGGIETMQLQAYQVVSRAYVWIHKPDEEEIDLMLGSMRPV